MQKVGGWANHHNKNKSLNTKQIRQKMLYVGTHVPHILMHKNKSKTVTCTAIRQY